MDSSRALSGLNDLIFIREDRFRRNTPWIIEKGCYVPLGQGGIDCLLVLDTYQRPVLHRWELLSRTGWIGSRRVDSWGTTGYSSTAGNPQSTTDLIFSWSIWITPLLIQWPRKSTFVWAPFRVQLLFLLHPEHCTQGSKPPVSDYKRLCHRGFPLQTGQGKGLSYPFKCGTRPELGRYS